MTAQSSEDSAPLAPRPEDSKAGSVRSEQSRFALASWLSCLLIFGLVQPVFCVIPLLRGGDELSGINVVQPRVLIMLAGFSLVLLVLCAYAMSRSWRWLELDGDLLRGRRFISLRSEEHRTADILAIHPLRIGYRIILDGGKSISLVRRDLTKIEAFAEGVTSLLRSREGADSPEGVVPAAVQETPPGKSREPYIRITLFAVVMFFYIVTFFMLALLMAQEVSVYFLHLIAAAGVLEEFGNWLIVFSVIFPIFLVFCLFVLDHYFLRAPDKLAVVFEFPEPEKQKPTQKNEGP